MDSGVVMDFIDVRLDTSGQTSVTSCQARQENRAHESDRPSADGADDRQAASGGASDRPKKP